MSFKFIGIYWNTWNENLPVVYHNNVQQNVVDGLKDYLNDLYVVKFLVWIFVALQLMLVRVKESIKNEN